MLTWKQLVHGFFGAIGVTAFLTVVANEIECHKQEVDEHRERNSSRARALKAAGAKPPERQAA